MLYTKISSLLKEIQSSDLEPAYCRVTDKAVEWTICGFVDEGIKLLEILWSFGLEHSRNVWLKDEGLQVMWLVANKKPNNIPFQFKSIEEIESENFSRVFYPYEEDIKEILASHKEEAKVMVFEEITSNIESPNSVGYRLFHDSCFASLFACKCGDLERAEHFIKIWGEGYKKYPSNYLLSYLMRDKASAAVLLKGMLAPILEVNKQKCEIETAQIKKALELRIKEGRTLVYGRLSWKQLLSRVSQLAIEQQTSDFSDEQISSNWLGFKGATASAIKKTEERLGVTLPEDYKAFLKVSNGFECISNIDVTLMHVETIDYLKILDRQLVDIWTGDPDREDFNQQLASSIVIGGFEEEQQLLLVPIGEGIWECWFFAHWIPGEEKYPSFRYYIEHVMERLDEGFFRS